MILLPAEYKLSCTDFTHLQEVHQVPVNQLPQLFLGQGVPVPDAYRILVENVDDCLNCFFQLRKFPLDQRLANLKGKRLG